MAIQAKNRSEIENAIRNRQPFRIASMSGVQYNPGPGRLNKENADRLRSDRPVYVVMSYDTPIAWVAADGWKVAVEQRFSATTSNHQTIARMALGI